MIGKAVKGYYVPVIILLFWITGSWLKVWNSYIIPPPHEVLSSAYKLMVDGTLFKHIFTSMYRVFAGFAAACLVAFPLGVFLGMNQRYNDYFHPMLEFIRHVPPLAAMPMLILWFGIGETPKLLIVILASFFPVFLNTMDGVVRCDGKLIEVGKSFGMSRGTVFRRIIMPAALPSVLVGMRLGLGYSWRALVGAELIAASSGIGYMILDAEQLARPDIVILGILTIGIVGSVVDWLVFYLTKRVIPWKEGEDTDYGRG